MAMYVCMYVCMYSWQCVYVRMYAYMAMHLCMAMYACMYQCCAFFIDSLLRVRSKTEVKSDSGIKIGQLLGHSCSTTV